MHPSQNIGKFPLFPFLVHSLQFALSPRKGIVGHTLIANATTFSRFTLNTPLSLRLEHLSCVYTI